MRNNMKILGIGSTFEFRGKTETVLEIVKKVDASGSYYYLVTNEYIISTQEMEKILNL
jgi:hypothetical protein